MPSSAVCKRQASRTAAARARKTTCRSTTATTAVASTSATRMATAGSSSPTPTSRKRCSATSASRRRYRRGSADRQSTSPCGTAYPAAPRPETFNGIVLGRIGGQVFEHHPGVLSEKPLDGTALVHRGIIQDHDEQGLRKPLMELVQELQKKLGRAAWGALPIEA